MSEDNSQENKSQPERVINLYGGNYNENLRDYHQNSSKNEQKNSLNSPSNLNRSGVDNFVGREKQLEKLHQLLQENEQVSISAAIAGMGGIGKTELALQYARTYQDEYPGSLCWFSVRGENLGTQIIEYARTYLEISVPDELEDLAKVGYCWRKWNSKASLIVLDDIANYEDFYQDSIEPYLPPVTSQVKVLMTSREIPSGIKHLDLDVLTEDAAIQLLKSLIGNTRVENELEVAQELCQWLGYLPLGLELVGRYIALDQTLSIEKALKRLRKDKLDAKSLKDPKQRGITAQKGVKAALDLSWDVLSPEAQELGCYLSLFNSEPFYWVIVEGAWIESSDEEEREDEIEELDELRNLELIQRNLMKVVPDTQTYQLHSLVAQYFRAKLEERAQAAELKQKFCGVMSQIASRIPQTPTLEDIRALTIAIPHLTSVATELTSYIDDEDLIWSFNSIGRFYNGQGLYNQALAWHEQCLKVCRERLGEQHPDVASSLNNLALLYKSQGRYESVEPLYLQALELYKQLLGSQHPDVASSLNNLALLYSAQGRYEEAEPLYLQALEQRKQLLGEQHPDVATSLNNLAALYKSQGRYEEADPLMLQALELFKQLLGEQHPLVATSLNNLAELYHAQGRYEDAEPLYLQALELRKQLLGEQHPDVASSLNNLALLYSSQGRYEDAEPLYLQALEL
ncbi:MAG: tetratricopeptide repeat protein, partial [Cyanobacteria bacterium J06621_8]